MSSDFKFDLPPRLTLPTKWAVSARATSAYDAEVLRLFRSAQAQEENRRRLSIAAMLTIAAGAVSAIALVQSQHKRWLAGVMWNAALLAGEVSYLLGILRARRRYR